MGPESPGLRDHAERAGALRPLFEIGAESRRMANMQVEQAEAIRAAQPHAAPSRDVGQMLLHCSALPAGFGKPGGEHDDGAHPFGDRGLERRDRERRRHRNQREFDLIRNRRQIGIGPHPLHRVAVRVDRIEPACVARFEEIAQRPALIRSGSFEAPKIATERGAKSGLSGCGSVMDELS
jgi:hypothetical protein